MRYFRYNEQGPDDLTPHIVVTVSEQYILKTYWPYWKRQAEAHGDVPDPEKCIEDFCVVHWAWEVTGGKDHSTG